MTELKIFGCTELKVLIHGVIPIPIPSDPEITLKNTTYIVFAIRLAAGLVESNSKAIDSTFARDSTKNWTETRAYTQ